MLQNRLFGGGRRWVRSKAKAKRGGFAVEDELTVILGGSGAWEGGNDMAPSLGGPTPQRGHVVPNFF